MSPKERTQLISRVGRWTVELVRYLCYVCALSFRVLVVAPRRRSWPRTVRQGLIRQIYAAGGQSIHFILFVALLVGVAVVLQAQLWLQRYGQTHLLGPVLVSVVIRELAPLLANIVVIGRTGSAIARRWCMNTDNPNDSNGLCDLLQNGESL